MSDEQKTYVPGVFVKEHTFPSTGNTILKVSIKAAELVAFMNQHTDERGWLNMGISRRRTTSDRGLTHTVWLDTWKPDPSRQRQAARPVEPSPLPAARQDDKPDDLPF